MSDGKRGGMGVSQRSGMGIGQRGGDEDRPPVPVSDSSLVSGEVSSLSGGYFRGVSWGTRRSSVTSVCGGGSWGTWVSSVGRSGGGGPGWSTADGGGSTSTSSESEVVSTLSLDLRGVLDWERGAASVEARGQGEGAVPPWGVVIVVVVWLVSSLVVCAWVVCSLVVVCVGLWGGATGLGEGGEVSGLGCGYLRSVLGNSGISVPAWGSGGWNVSSSGSKGIEMCRPGSGDFWSLLGTSRMTSPLGEGCPDY